MVCGRLCSQYPEFVPYCTMQETYTGGVAKTVVGSKAYHNAYGANSCYGCGSGLCPLYEPIKASGHSKSKCMSPPSQVQRHKCRDKKCYGKCEEGEPKVCKYGYPREFCNKDLAKSTITGRNIYRCEKKEDQRLSPYIPLWLLATGLSTLTPLVLAYEL